MCEPIKSVLTEEEKSWYTLVPIPWHPFWTIGYRNYDDDHCEVIFVCDKIDFHREAPYNNKLWESRDIMKILTEYFKGIYTKSTDSLLTAIPAESYDAIKICVKKPIPSSKDNPVLRANAIHYELHAAMNALDAIISDREISEVTTSGGEVVGYKFTPFEILPLIKTLEDRGELHIEPSVSQLY